METRRKQSISGDGFSFPSTPEPDNNHHSRGSSSDFEFGSITPDSPYSDDPSKNSPADHLFFNGKLLPHSFPFQPTNTTSIYGVVSENSSRSMIKSRTSSSNSSKDSMMSTSSSSSDNSERRLLYCQRSKTTSLSVMGRESRSDQIRYGGGSKAVSAQVYGSSQRWQFMAHPVPALSRETSLRRRKTEVSGNNNKTHNDEERRSIPKKKKKRTVIVKRLRFGRTPRIFRWFFAACRECHAIEPSKKKKS
uniref:Uncharacterized protein n=1 Tax=Cannabis sativa TaxID=3483 RepID=A0A803NWC2_CANSA